MEDNVYAVGAIWSRTNIENRNIMNEEYRITQLCQVKIDNTIKNHIPFALMVGDSKLYALLLFLAN